MFKFSPDGKLLMTLGKPGGAADPDYFYQPNDVVVAPNGDIFVVGRARRRQRSHPEVLEGRQVHQGVRQERARARASSTSRTRSPSTRGTPVRRRPQQQPHPDSRPGRQVHLETWRSSAGRAASRSTRTTCSTSPTPSRVGHPKPRGGSAASASASEDGKVTAFIPDPEARSATGHERGRRRRGGCAGNIYGAEVGPKGLKKYVPS